MSGDHNQYQKPDNPLIDALERISTTSYIRDAHNIAIEALAHLAPSKKVCTRCGKVNPAEIHTCSPKQPEPVAWLDSLDSSQPHAVTGFQYLSVSQIERGEQHKYIPVYAALPRESGCGKCGKKQSDGWALYCVECSAPMREWVGLTDEEKEYFKKLGLVGVEIIESKLKDKNV